MNKGRLIATGTVAELMKELDLTSQLYVNLQDETKIDKAMTILERAGAKDVSIKNGWMVMGVGPGSKLSILNSLTQEGFALKDFRIDEPNLEDAFLRQTGEGNVS